MRESETMRQVIINGPEDFPKTPHYAIALFETSTVHHEGDERSRQCPGHGYPAYTETLKNCKLYYYYEKGFWEEDVVYLHNLNQKFVAYHVDNVATVVNKVIINE